MSKKNKTNVQIVKGIMENSQYGALSQLFVMDALHKFSKSVSESSEKDYPKNGFISAQAWIGVAKEINDKLNNKEA